MSHTSKLLSHQENTHRPPPLTTRHYQMVYRNHLGAQNQLSNLKGHGAQVP